MTDLAIAYLPIHLVRVASRNARTHTPQQIAQISRSIAEFGWTNPILVDERSTIIAGHGRLEAAKQRGLAEVPTITLTGLSADQKRALAIADNQLALNAGWDEETLRLELGELGAAGFDVSLIGFSDAELDQIAAPDTDPMAEWQGMPEFNQPAAGAFHTVAVHFKDQVAIDAFARLLGQRIEKTTKFTWFPRVEYENFMDDRYVDAAAVSNLHPI